MTITATAKRSGGEPTRGSRSWAVVWERLLRHSTSPARSSRVDTRSPCTRWAGDSAGKSTPDSGAHDRIEEHGLHLWFGFYENTFRLIRECYDELDRDLDAPLAHVDDAFRPATAVRRDRTPCSTAGPASGQLVPRHRRCSRRRPRWQSVTRCRRVRRATSRARCDRDAGPDDGRRRSRTRSRKTHDPSANEASVDDGVGKASHGSVRAVVAPPEQDLSTFVDATRRRVDLVASVVDDVELSLLVAAYEAAATIESVLDWAGTGGSRVVGLLDQFVDGLEDRIAATLQNQEAGRSRTRDGSTWRRRSCGG